VRPPRLDIPIPEFPPDIEWINARFVRLGTLLGRNAVLVWFWDYSSLNSLRALPYLLEWHRRYGDSGLRVLGVHSPQFEFGRDRENVVAAAARLGIEFPVAHDAEFAAWRQYGNEVWPALYLWDRKGVLRYYHFAEGAYEETERAIGELLLEIDEDLALPDPVPPLRPTDRPGAPVEPPTPHRYLEEDRSGRSVEAGEQLSIRYAGAEAAAVLDGQGTVEVSIDGRAVRRLELDGPRLYELYETPGHEEHLLTVRFEAPATAYMFSFAPGPVR
jgi:Thioredoxin like C-terminal domain/AhpC/TSA family